uniref:Uncharacterized protein n=1 Tax=Knipowitschia caucasica TaxID=637954 RepID=A0AAV2IWI0_KNICA
MPGSSFSFPLPGRISHTSSSSLPLRPPPPPRSAPPFPRLVPVSRLLSCPPPSASFTPQAPRRLQLPESWFTPPCIWSAPWLTLLSAPTPSSSPPPPASSAPPKLSSASLPPPSALSAPPKLSSAPPPPGRLQLTPLTESWFSPLCVRKVPRRKPPSKPAPPAKTPQLSKANPVPIAPQSQPTPVIPGPTLDRAVSQKAHPHKRKRSRLLFGIKKRNKDPTDKTNERS